MIISINDIRYNGIPSDLALGDTPINKMYIGSNLVWLRAEDIIGISWTHPNTDHGSCIYYEGSDVTLDNVLNGTYRTTDNPIVPTANYYVSFRDSYAKSVVINTPNKAIESLYLFAYGNQFLESVDFVSYDSLAQSTNLDYAFFACHNLKHISISGNFYKNQAIYDYNNTCGGAAYAFAQCSIESIDLSKSTFNVESSVHMFLGCDKLKSVGFPLRFQGLRTAEGMFEECGIESIRLNYLFDTSLCTSFENMFYRCDNLADIDMNINTSNATNVFAMFDTRSNIDTLNLHHFDTTSVEGVPADFYDNLPTQWNRYMVSIFGSSIFFERDSFRHCNKLWLEAEFFNAEYSYDLNVVDWTDMDSLTHFVEVLPLRPKNTLKHPYIVLSELSWSAMGGVNREALQNKHWHICIASSNKTEHVDESNIPNDPYYYYTIPCEVIEPMWI